MTTTKLFVLFIVALFTVGVFAEDPTAPPASDADTFAFSANDRRDPFTFCKAYPKARIVAPEEPGKIAPDDPTRLDPEQIAAKRAELLRYNDSAEQLLMADHAQEAVSMCDRAFETLKGVKVSDYKELQAPRDYLLRVQKAATRRKNRDDAERDFAIINLHLTGVICSAKMPRAIVNGKIVTMGDTIHAGDEDCPLFSIAPGQITVVFRNYIMPVNLEK